MIGKEKQQSKRGRRSGGLAQQVTKLVCSMTTKRTLIPWCRTSEEHLLILPVVVRCT